MYRESECFEDVGVEGRKTVEELAAIEPLTLRVEKSVSRSAGGSDLEKAVEPPGTDVAARLA